MLIYFLTIAKKKVIEFRSIRNLLLRTWFGEPGHGYAGEGEVKGTTIIEIRVQMGQVSKQVARVRMK